MGHAPEYQSDFGIWVYLGGCVKAGAFTYIPFPGWIVSITERRTRSTHCAPRCSRCGTVRAQSQGRNDSLRGKHMDDPLNDLQHAVAEPYLLYRSAISLATQVDRFFERRFKSDGIELAVRVMEVAAELGTVLLSPPTERNSSGTASLRRAFGRISSAIETAQQLERQKMLSSARCKGLSELLFEIRDGIIVLIGDRGNAKPGELDKQN